MKLYSEEQLLDPVLRKQIIDEIEDDGNIKRKNEAKKRHEVFKDNTVKFVMKKLENEGLLPQTLTLMQNRAANVSICKKIINKLARAYQNGVTRETGVDMVNLQISHCAMLLDFDSRQKKNDRFLRLQRNSLLWFMPEKCLDEKYIIKAKIMGPWQYDAVENSVDANRPIAIVFSDYYDPQTKSSIKGGRNQVTYTDAEKTEWKDTAIADGPNVTTIPDERKKTYIFWGHKYHFTCNRAGEIIPSLSGENNLNPIGCIPGVAMGKDRDEGFWADGGQDLVDGSILINTMLTDMNAILFMQGWGQMVITGAKGSVKKELESGPHRAMVLTYDTKKAEKPPTVTVVSSNPPVDSWMKAIEQYVALLLSTNNLSPASVAGKLDASNMASGIALVIDRSDSTEEVTDSQAEFARCERHAWKIYSKWHNLFYERNMLDNEFAAVGRLPDSEQLEVTCKFHPGTEVVTEGERLDNMKKKKELGLVRQVELLMEENPGMTEDEATAKLLQIKKERAEEAELMMRTMANDMSKGQKNNQQQEDDGGNDE